MLSLDLSQVIESAASRRHVLPAGLKQKWQRILLRCLQYHLITIGYGTVTGSGQNGFLEFHRKYSAIWGADQVIRWQSHICGQLAWVVAHLRGSFKTLS